MTLDEYYLKATYKMMLYKGLSNITHHLLNSKREVGGVVEILLIVELTHRMTCVEMKFTDQEK